MERCRHAAYCQGDERGQPPDAGKRGAQRSGGGKVVVLVRFHPVRPRVLFAGVTESDLRAVGLSVAWERTGEGFYGVFGPGRLRGALS